jgi:hypothetical protein
VVNPWPPADAMSPAMRSHSPLRDARPSAADNFSKACRKSSPIYAEFDDQFKENTIPLCFIFSSPTAKASVLLEMSRNALPPIWGTLD